MHGLRSAGVRARDRPKKNPDRGCGGKTVRHDKLNDEYAMHRSNGQDYLKSYNY